MKTLSMLSLSLLFCVALQSSQDATVRKGSWFQGPIGPIGPTGPQGERGSRGPRGDKGPAFASAYGYASLAVANDQLTPIQDRVAFSAPSKESLCNMSWNVEEKQFQIQETGMYEISYFVHAFSNCTEENTTTLQASIVYGTTTPSSISFVSLFHPGLAAPAIADCETSGTTFVRLNKGDLVGLELRKTNKEYSAPIYWQTMGIAASLSLKRISD